MEGRLLDYIALTILCLVVLTLVYGIIFIHDIPYNIAKKRNHPHQDAIHTAGWVSLFLMHTIWPFLWIWATMYKPGYGWGMRPEIEADPAPPPEKALIELTQLTGRIAALEIEKKQLQETLGHQIQQLQDRIAILESDQTEGGIN